jgi:hypothetical protein
MREIRDFLSGVKPERDECRGVKDPELRTSRKTFQKNLCHRVCDASC